MFLKILAVLTVSRKYLWNVSALLATYLFKSQAEENWYKIEHRED